MSKVRQRTILKSLARHWTEWQKTEITPEMRQKYPLLKNAQAVYANSRFEVQVFSCGTSIGGVQQVTIIRHGDIEPVKWEEVQRAIHELFGPEVTAVEIYPPLQHEWQTRTNLRVVWILPTTWPLPFGLQMENAWGKPTA